MEVTKSNFKELFPKLKEAVEECDFLAIDTELTGLKTKREKEHAFDTMDERYHKVLKTSKDFLIIQFGISCFKYHKDKNKYIHKDFNFYVFPRPYARYAPDSFFICQPSSLSFLSKFEFDFNKWIHEGISYIRPHEEEKLRVSLKARHEEETALKTPSKVKVPKETKNIPIPDEQKSFVELIHQKIDDFINDEMEKTLYLPPCNAYRRKLIYQNVDHNMLGLQLSTSLNDSGLSCILVEKADDDEKIRKLQLKQLADVDELNDAVGFRKVVDIISASQALVIGHNMLLDIFHTVHQFFHPLPSDLRDFKELVISIFPRLMDTKTLSSASVFKDSISSTALADLFAELKKNKYNGQIEAAEGFKCYDVDLEKNHEAGFDAFMTGYCFIKLALVLKKQDKNEDYVSINSSSLKPYMNRPYVMGHFNVQSLNLTGPDPEASRDHIFHISFPKEWRTEDLIELFNPYGSVYISWLDDTSALIGLKSPEQSVNVKRVLLKERNSKYTVKTYADYKDMSSDPPSSEDSDSFDEPCKKRKLSSNASSNTSVIQSAQPMSSTDGNCSPNKQERKPKPKKQKVVHEDEVSSTEKLFEEPAGWW